MHAQVGQRRVAAEARAAGRSRRGARRDCVSSSTRWRIRARRCRSEIRMSRSRRTVRALSSPISASDIGLTRTGPMVGAHLLRHAELGVGGLLQEHREVAHHRAFDQPGDARRGRRRERRRVVASRPRRPRRAVATPSSGRRPAPVDRCWRSAVSSTPDQASVARFDLQQVEQQPLSRGRGSPRR